MWMDIPTIVNKLLAHESHLQQNYSMNNNTRLLQRMRKSDTPFFLEFSRVPDPILVSLKGEYLFVPSVLPVSTPSIGW